MEDLKEYADATAKEISELPIKGQKRFMTALAFHLGNDDEVIADLVKGHDRKDEKVREDHEVDDEALREGHDFDPEAGGRRMCLLPESQFEDDALSHKGGPEGQGQAAPPEILRGAQEGLFQMIIDWIVRLIDERVEAEKAKAAKKDEAPPVVSSLAGPPPRPRSQPLPEKPGGLSMKAERFLADVVEPHQDSFHSLSLLEIVYDLVMTLDEHGFCPSVVQTLKRHDADAALDGKFLSLVSLDEHSYRVARMMADLYREDRRERDCDILTPGLVIAEPRSRSGEDSSLQGKTRGAVCHGGSSHHQRRCRGRDLRFQQERDAPRAEGSHSESPQGRESRELSA